MTAELLVQIIGFIIGLMLIGFGISGLVQLNKTMKSYNKNRRAGKRTTLR